MADAPPYKEYDLYANFGGFFIVPSGRHALFDGVCGVLVHGIPYAHVIVRCKRNGYELDPDSVKIIYWCDSHICCLKKYQKLRFVGEYSYDISVLGC